LNTKATQKQHKSNTKATQKQHKSNSIIVPFLRN